MKKIRLNDLAAKLGIGGANLRYHVRFKDRLGEGAEKIGNKQTGDFLIPLETALNFISWAHANGRNYDYDTLVKVEEELRGQLNSD